LAAFDAGGTNTVELIANFITVFESVVSDASLISNPQTRTKILVMLSVADIALHTVAEILKNEEPKPSNAVFRGAVSRDSRDAILAFDKRPKMRCRSSVTGKFEKMSFCEKNPDKSVVETFVKQVSLQHCATAICTSEEIVRLAYAGAPTSRPPDMCREDHLEPYPCLWVRPIK
jgi:hypothetical protein